MDYYDDPAEETDFLGTHLHEAGIGTIARPGKRSKVGFTPFNTAQRMTPTPTYMMPMTPYGDKYTPSYTRYQNSPANSYTNPMHVIFNDRRPQTPAIRTTLFPKEGA
jgi:hypothetical protein